MPKKIEPTPIRILEERMKLVWLLAWKGYGDTDIGEILNGLDRTWVYRLRKRMPKGWRPEYAKLQDK